MPFLGPFVKLRNALKERGLKGTIIQLYTIGEIKLGTLKGVDTFGNKYYENLSYPFGQHRWIEYADIHNFDATMIQPEWHGWMHHVFDETPDQPFTKTGIPLITETDAIYKNHIGLTNYTPSEQVNTTTYRQRGYGIGSLKTGPGEPDVYYKQPGHPFHPDVEKGGRFRYRKEVQGYKMRDNELSETSSIDAK